MRWPGRPGRRCERGAARGGRGDVPRVAGRPGRAASRGYDGRRAGLGVARGRRPAWGRRGDPPGGLLARRRGQRGVQPQRIGEEYRRSVERAPQRPRTDAAPRARRRPRPRTDRRPGHPGMAAVRGSGSRSGMTEPLHRALGLTDDEFASIVERLGRDPNRAELAMYSVMWSEHCSYKSSKVHLRTLPTEGPQVLVGPGQDAGVVDVGDGMACVFKMESHSHPSAIEPYQGAATGVGGIVRDVLSMGARPAALLDPLRFGPLDDPRNRFLFGGVVAGIGGYGNCIGVPTVGGEVKFAECHSANPTVNVMCLGFGRADGLLQGHAGGPGSVLLLIGAATGRDGIGGVSVLASRTIEDDAHASRPSVQIGDPFLEKLLIEACLELKARGLLEGLKDLGGAGLTCAVSEAAAGVRLGAALDLDRVPLRDAPMVPFA